MRQIADALTFVNDHYQEEVKVCTLAQVCGMSETSFRKVFEEYVHMLPMDYVNLVRVQYACEQMKHGNDSMDEVVNTFFEFFLKNFLIHRHTSGRSIHSGMSGNYRTFILTH